MNKPAQIGDAKDFLVTIRVQNNRIIQRMRAAGIVSCRQLAMMCDGCNYVRITELVRFKRSPLSKRGEWTNSALSISAALHCEPEELWPERLQQIRAKRGRIELEANRAELESIPTNRLQFESKDLDLLLGVLRPRERFVIERRFGLGGAEMTLDEIAAEIDRRTEKPLSREQTRQIEARGLRRMRDKARQLRLAGPLS